MRQLSASSNLLLTCLAAVGLLGTLSLPWYAAPVEDENVYDGPIEKGAFQVSHVFSHSTATTTGSTAAGGAQVLLLALVGVIIVLAALASSPGIRAKVRDGLRLVALVLPIGLLYVAVAHPGVTGALRIHWGMLASFALSLLVASAAWQGGEVRRKRGPSGAWAQPQRR